MLLSGLLLSVLFLSLGRRRKDGTWPTGFERTVRAVDEFRVMGGDGAGNLRGGCGERGRRVRGAGPPGVEEGRRKDGASGRASPGIGKRLRVGLGLRDEAAT